MPLDPISPCGAVGGVTNIKNGLPYDIASSSASSSIEYALLANPSVEQLPDQLTGGSRPL